MPSISKILKFSVIAVGLVLVVAGCANQVRQKLVSAPVRVDTIRLDYSNVHLVRANGTAFLVDAGGEETGADLVAALGDLGVNPKDLAAVVLTHGHADHAGAARLLKKDYGVPIVAGQGDESMLASGRNDALCPVGFMARRQLAQAQQQTYQPTKADRLISEAIPLAEVLGISDLGGRIVPVPGHTPGSIVIAMGDIAFVGDIIRGGIFSHSATRHFFMCDLADNDADIRRVLDDIAPAAKQFFAGHFGPITRASLKGFITR